MRPRAVAAGVRALAVLMLAVVLAAVVMWGGTASASGPSRARLDYQLGSGAGDCPSRNLLRDSVLRRLGYDPFEPDASERVWVVIDGRGSLLAATVRFFGADGAETGVRVVEAAGAYCLELVDVVALAVSLALDPAAAQRMHRPRRARSPETRAVRRPPAAPAQIESAEPGAVGRPADTNLPTPPALIGGALYLDVLVTGGAAPRASAGVAVGGALRGDIWSAVLELRSDLPSSKSVGGARVGTHLVVASLMPCLHYGPLGGCAVVTAGAVFARASGFASAGAGRTPYVAGGLRASFEWPLFGAGPSGDITVRLSAELMLPLTRTALHVGDDEVWSTPPASGSAMLGLGWRFD